MTNLHNCYSYVIGVYKHVVDPQKTKSKAKDDSHVCQCDSHG